MKLHTISIQFETQPGKLHQNLATAEKLIKASLQELPTDYDEILILLPEFFHCGYSYDENSSVTPEKIDGLTVQWMHMQSKMYGVWLGGCIFEEAYDGFFDTFVLIDPLGQVAKHRKRYPSSFECFFFESGEDPLVVETRLGRVALVICYEAMHTSLLNEAITEKADFVLMSFSSPGQPRFYPFRRLPSKFLHQLATTWSRLCQVPTISACVSGDWDSKLLNFPLLRLRLPFMGQSCIVDEKGDMLASMEEGEGFLSSTLTITQDRPSKPSLPALPTKKYVVKTPFLVRLSVEFPSKLKRLWEWFQ